MLSSPFPVCRLVDDEWGECGLWDRHLGWVCIGFTQLPSDISVITCFLLRTKEREYCKVPQGYHVSSLLLCDKLPDGLGSRMAWLGSYGSGAYRRLQSAEGAPGLETYLHCGSPMTSGKFVLALVM